MSQPIDVYSDLKTKQWWQNQTQLTSHACNNGRKMVKCITIKKKSKNSKMQFARLPDNVCKHWPFVVSQTLTVESAFPDTKIFCRSSIPEVRLWWPISVCLQVPVVASHTRIDVSSEPDTTCTPSNWEKTKTIQMQQINKWKKKIENYNKMIVDHVRTCNE